DQLITISSESVIIFPRNPDHDHPGIVITIARNRRSPSPGIRTGCKIFDSPFQLCVNEHFQRGKREHVRPQASRLNLTEGAHSGVAILEDSVFKCSHLT
ncbi:MAG: hypothetical protein WCA19_21555, partial [Candidatus Acidiferrales bacterium]